MQIPCQSFPLNSNPKSFLQKCENESKFKFQEDRPLTTEPDTQPKSKMPNKKNGKMSRVLLLKDIAFDCKMPHPFSTKAKISSNLLTKRDLMPEPESELRISPCQSSENQRSTAVNNTIIGDSMEFASKVLKINSTLNSQGNSQRPSLQMKSSDQ